MELPIRYRSAAAGSLASPASAKARGATLRRDLIHVAARTARHGRGHITVHLPDGWHREHEWVNLFEAACGARQQQRPDQTRSPHPIYAVDRGLGRENMNGHG